VRRLILHIGSEKTGSTAIQAFLDSAAEQFKNIQIMTEFGGSNSRQFTAAFCDENDDYWISKGVSGENFALKQKALRDQIEEYFTNLPTILNLVISSEHLSSRMNPNSIRALYELTKQYFQETHIIWILRDQAALVESRYWTYLALGGTNNLLAKPGARALSNQVWNHQIAIQSWQENYPDAHLNILSYHKLITDDKSVIPKFLQILNRIVHSTAQSKSDDKFVIMKFLRRFGGFSNDPAQLKALDLHVQKNVRPSYFTCLIIQGINTILKENTYKNIENRDKVEKLRTLIVEYSEQLNYSKESLRVNRNEWNTTFYESNKWVMDNFPETVPLVPEKTKLSTSNTYQLQSKKAKLAIQEEYIPILLKEFDSRNELLKRIGERLSELQVEFEAEFF
jgi:hypothetical protein